MSVEAVMAMAMGMGAGEGDREVLLPLCRAAMREMETLLKEGCAVSDCEEAFTVACAWLALDGLETAGGSAVTAFSAGDLTIRAEGATGETERRSKALRLMAPYIRAPGFAFRGV